MARRILTSALLIQALLGAQEPEVRTTARDRRALAVTVYADGRALVQDTRRVTLPRGTFSLAFADVSAQLRPATAQFGLRDATRITTLEQNFEFDILTPERLLEASLGTPVRVRLAEDGRLVDGKLRGIPHREILAPPPTPAETAQWPRHLRYRLAQRGQSRLLSADPDAVVEVPGGYISATPDQVLPRTVPAGLRASPTLLQRMRSQADEVRDLDLTYLTSGLTWKATYRADLSVDGKSLDLTAYVTLRNETGTAFPDTLLQLVAGEPNSALDPYDERAGNPSGACVVEVVASAVPAFRQEALSEYLLFTLSRPTTLASGQEKQIHLFDAARIPIQMWKSLNVWLTDSRSSAWQEPVDSCLMARFENSKGGQLGRPLPRGEVFLSQGGHLLSTPEYRPEGELPALPLVIDDTPVGEVVEWTVAEDSRLRARVRCVDSEDEDAQGHHELSFEVEIWNGFQDPVKSELNLLLQPGWQIRDCSERFEKVDAGITVFRPQLAPGERKTIRVAVLTP